MTSKYANTAALESALKQARLEGFSVSERDRQMARLRAIPEQVVDQLSRIQSRDAIVRVLHEAIEAALSERPLA